MDLPSNEAHKPGKTPTPSFSEQRLGRLQKNKKFYKRNSLDNESLHRDKMPLLQRLKSTQVPGMESKIL
jgi:hypothetical protein